MISKKFSNIFSENVVQENLRGRYFSIPEGDKIIFFISCKKKSVIISLLFGCFFSFFFFFFFFFVCVCVYFVRSFLDCCFMVSCLVGFMLMIW